MIELVDFSDWADFVKPIDTHSLRFAFSELFVNMVTHVNKSLSLSQLTTRHSQLLQQFLDFEAPFRLVSWPVVQYLGRVVKLADTSDLGSDAERFAGSSPASPTKLKGDCMKISKKTQDRIVSTLPKYQKILALANDRDLNESDAVCECHS